MCANAPSSQSPGLPCSAARSTNTQVNSEWDACTHESLRELCFSDTADKIERLGVESSREKMNAWKNECRPGPPRRQRRAGWPREGGANPGAKAWTSSSGRSRTTAAPAAPSPRLQPLPRPSTMQEDAGTASCWARGRPGPVTGGAADPRPPRAAPPPTPPPPLLGRPTSGQRGAAAQPLTSHDSRVGKLSLLCRLCLPSAGGTTTPVTPPPAVQ